MNTLFHILYFKKKPVKIEEDNINISSQPDQSGVKMLGCLMMSQEVNPTNLSFTLDQYISRS